MTESISQKPFYGREPELTKLGECLRRKKADLIVIKGRRRIGKSRLAKEFANRAEKTGYQTIVLSGMAPGPHSKQDEYEDFAQQLAQECDIPPPRADNWNQLLWALADRVKAGNFIVILDEINWMGSKDPTFLAKLKNAWDRYFSETPHLILILSGSLAGWIELNILKSTGFLGRITLDISLQELPLADCNKFWGQRESRISAYEKLQLLSVTGGIPRYLEEIDTSQTASDNLRRMCFEPEGILFREFDNLFADLFSRRQSIYKEIITAIAVEPTELSTLYEKLERPKSGYLSEYVDDLEKNGFISRDFTWSLKTGKQSKYSHLRLTDNYLRFYLRYVQPIKNKIERGSLKNLPNVAGILGLQFENIVLKNRATIWELLNLSVDQIVYDNPYFQRPTKRRRGCQIDYAIQSSSNTLYICELKFKKTAIQSSIIDEMQDKINAIDKPENTNIRPVLIHVNGVSQSIIDSDYFDEIIDFGQLLQG
ncbi:MAG: ATP-binding protein [Pseudomonadales bacterium]|nr:ATP-binding protein [Pseudomonadales bacterium]